MSQQSEDVRSKLGSGQASVKTRLYSVAVPVVLGLCGVALLVGSLALGVGTTNEPGPGLWPFAIACTWTLAAATIAWESFKGTTLPPVGPSGRPAVGFGLTLAFILIFSYIGLIPAVLIVTSAWMKLLSDMSWKRILIASLTITALLYILFAIIIGTAFPASVLPIP
jgi:putative tricarboxylic transport membrane protein